MNILVVYNRDIALNDAGASRTVIELANYLSDKENMNVFAAFVIINGNKGKIKEVPIDRSNAVSEYKRVIRENQIDIIIVPEAIKLASILYEAKIGTNAKIISALHTKPGYEKIRLYVNFYEELLYSRNWINKIKSLIKLLIYPYFNSRSINDIEKKMQNAYAVSDRVVLLSERYKKPFIKEYKLKDGGLKLAAIPNGLSYGDLFISDADFLKKQNVCLVVGRLDERSKRLSLVLRMWKSIKQQAPEWKLVVVGTGPSEKYYKDLVRMYHLQDVCFMGHQEPLSFYKSAKVFFMTSAFEGQPMTLLEALPMGCVPVVMNSFESVYDTIYDGENGFIASKCSEFVDKSLKLMKDSQLRITMAKNGIKKCNKFSREKTYELYYKLLIEG